MTTRFRNSNFRRIYGIPLVDSTDCVVLGIFIKNGKPSSSIICILSDGQEIDLTQTRRKIVSQRRNDTCIHRFFLTMIFFLVSNVLIEFIELIAAHDLAGSDQGGFNDPYVRLSLLPEVDNRSRQTPVHRNDPNPFFDQHFKFPVSHDDLSEKTLLLQVYDYDR